MPNFISRLSYLVAKVIGKTLTLGEIRLEGLRPKNVFSLVDSIKHDVIICANNTPPASRKNSAPRGVTRFWDTLNSVLPLNQGHSL